MYEHVKVQTDWLKDKYVSHSHKITQHPILSSFIWNVFILESDVLWDVSPNLGMHSNIFLRRTNIQFSQSII